MHHLEALRPGKVDYRPAGDAVQEAIRLGCMENPVLDEEYIGARGLGDIAAPVQHHGVGETFPLGGVLGDGADHVKAGRLGGCRRGVGRRAAVLGPGERDALGFLVGIEIAGPIPDGDGDMDGRILGRDADRLGPAPGDRPHIAIGQAVARAGFLAGRIDLGHRERYREIEDFRRPEQPLGVLCEFEDLAAVHTFALEHGGGVVERMGQYVHLRLTPGYELAVQPDPAVAIIVGNQ